MATAIYGAIGTLGLYIAYKVIDRILSMIFEKK